MAAAGYYVRYFGSDWGRTFQIGFLFVAVLLLVFLFASGTLRAKLRVLVNLTRGKIPESRQQIAQILLNQPNDPNAALMTNLDKVEIKDNKITFYPKTK